MSERNKTIVIAAGGFVGALMMLGMTLYLNEGGGFDRATPASALGWTLPLGSLLVILGVTWLLLSRSAKDPGDDAAQYVPCARCGRSILRDWRLCPYCGVILDGSSGYEESSNDL